MRRLARQHLEEHCADRPHVGARIDVVLTTCLLGSHVERRADDLARAGDRRHVFEAKLRDPEVEQLHRPRPRVCRAGRRDEEHVLWLHVAMNDLRTMRGVEHLEHLLRHPTRWVWLEPFT